MIDHTAIATTHLSGHTPTGIPARIGKYEVREEIGRGSSGVVHRGFDPFVQRDVALKFALHEHASRIDVAHERAFFAEARAAGMLQHPNIVSLYDAGVENNLSYLVMEWVDGATLLPMCKPDAPRAPLTQVIDIASRCAKALDYAHARGVLHRDIKPGNIMLTQAGTPKLMDFSIAEILTGGDASGGTRGVAGSPLYMSPEQVARQPLGPASDLYALGTVIFQLLTGRVPFPNTDIPELFRAIRHQAPPRIAEARPDIPEALSTLLESLLSKDPAQRPESGAAVASVLSRLLDRLRTEDQQAGRRSSRDALRRLHFFNGFSDEDIDEILNASTMATYAPGDTLMKEGEIGHALFIIVLGSADVLKAGKPLHRMERGDCVGEIGFLTASRRTASVVASTQVLALKINATLLESVSRDCQLRFYKVFTETLIYRLSLTSAKLSARAT